jgi:transcription elongation factor Elf1
MGMKGYANMKKMKATKRDRCYPYECPRCNSKEFAIDCHETIMKITYEVMCRNCGMLLGEMEIE